MFDIQIRVQYYHMVNTTDEIANVFYILLNGFNKRRMVTGNLTWKKHDVNL